MAIQQDSRLLCFSTSSRVNMIYNRPDGYISPKIRYESVASWNTAFYKYITLIASGKKCGEMSATAHPRR